MINVWFNNESSTYDAGFSGLFAFCWDNDDEKLQRKRIQDLIDSPSSKNVSSDDRDEQLYTLLTTLQQADPTGFNTLINICSENGYDHMGQYPSHIACRAGFTKVVELLLQYGAMPHVNERGKYGKTTILCCIAKPPRRLFCLQEPSLHDDDVLVALMETLLEHYVDRIIECSDQEEK